jgi:hypothetical protein
VPHAALLAELYPDATFIHIVRDGRDVAASAHDLWSDFGAAYASVEAAAGVWRDAVRDVREHLGGLRYHEVRYEDLLADPVAGLAAILDTAGLRHDPTFLAEVVEFGRPPINVRPSKAEVGVRKWADAGPDHERAVFQAAGDLLVELGYASSAERTAAENQRTWRSTRNELRAKASTFGSRLARKARSLVDRRRRTQRVAAVDDVRRPGSALADHLVAGTDPGAVVAPNVTGEIDGSRVQGRDAVLAALPDLAGGKVAAVAADTEACLVQFVDAGGRRRLHRYFVDGGVVVRVVAE